MRSLFDTAFFGRPVITVDPVGGRLGQEDVFDDLGGLVEELDELTKGVDDLIAEIPVGKVRADFEKRRDDCATKSSFSKYQCYYTLFQDVKRAIQGEGGAAPPPASRPQPKEEGGFPIVPVAIGAVALSALIYIFVKG